MSETAQGWLQRIRELPIDGGVRIAVMLAREEFGLRGELQSDAASVLPLTRALLTLPGLRVREADIPVRDPVRAVCDMLGFDPLSLACEGRVVAVVSPADLDSALRALNTQPNGRQPTLAC